MSQDLRKAFENVSSTNMDDAQIPQQIRLFLKKHFESFQFKARKRRYILLRKRKQSDILDHLIQSYALINFWQLMFLGMVEESDHSFQLVKKSLEDFVVKMLKISGDEKPAYNFSEMILMAIESDEKKALSLNGVYNAIMEMFPYYQHLSDKKSGLGWKNSVRHDLSIRKYFVRQFKIVNGHKRGFWTVDDSQIHLLENGTEIGNVLNEDIPDSVKKEGAHFDISCLSDFAGDEDVKSSGDCEPNDHNEDEDHDDEDYDHKNDEGSGSNVDNYESFEIKKETVETGLYEDFCELKFTEEKVIPSLIKSGKSGVPVCVPDSGLYKNDGDGKDGDGSGDIGDGNDCEGDNSDGDDGDNNDEVGDNGDDDEEVGDNGDSDGNDEVESESVPISTFSATEQSTSGEGSDKYQKGNKESQGETESKKQLHVNSNEVACHPFSKVTKKKRKSVDELWKSCSNKIIKSKEKTNELKDPKDAEIESARLVSDKYYQRKHLFEKHLKRRAKILGEDGLKQHTVEALLILQNEEKQESKRRRQMNIYVPRVSCNICKAPLRRSNFEHAFIIHGLEYRGVCPVCGERDFPNLQAHYRMTHFGDLALNCNLCPAIYYSAKELQHHIVHHSTVMTVKCKKCKFIFPNEKELQQHMEKDHLQTSKPSKEKGPATKIPCEICGKLVSSRRGTLEQHKKFSHEEHKFQCPLCPRNFKNYCLVKTHLDQAHREDRSYVCWVDNCNKSFKSQARLTDHQIYHLPPKFECKTCKKKYYHIEHLKGHKCIDKPATWWSKSRRQRQKSGQ